MRSGAIIFVEIPVRDLDRAADFYAGLLRWSFEDDENVEGWHFTRVRVDRWVAFESNRIGVNQVLAVKPDERGGSGMPRTRAAHLT